ncbi:MAG: hypothetical protein ACRC9T_01795, partial [Vibrionaceae bacterium]
MSSSQEKKSATSLTLSTTAQHRALVTTQVKQALSLTQKLLSARNALIDESWMQEIWDWADAHNIPTSFIARDKVGLLQMTSLSFAELAKEITEDIHNLAEADFNLKYVCFI